MSHKATAINVGEKNLSTSTGYAVWALVLGFAGNFFSGFVSTLMSTYLPESVGDLLGRMDTEQISYVGSYIGSLYIVGWAVGGIAFGWFGDRSGRVLTLSVAMLLIGLFTLAASWSPNWYLLVVFRFMTGIGVGATMVLCAVFVAEVWGDRIQGRAIAVGLLGIGFPIGIIASGMFTYVIEDWRTAFLIGFAPLLLSIFCISFFKEPVQWQTLGSDEVKNHKKTKGSLLSLFEPENRTNFIVGSIVFGAMNMGIWSIFSWLPTWAQTLVDVESEGLRVGGTLVALLGLGGIIGCLFAGFLANYLGRKGALMLSFAGAGVASVILFLSNTGFHPFIYIETSFLSLFFGISQGILMAYIPELFPAFIRSTATGICFNAGRLLTAAAVFFVGALVPVLGGFGNALLVFSLTYVIGFIAVWFGEETKDVAL